MEFPGILTFRHTTENNVSILFLTGSIEERINTSVDVSENTIEYFLKNLNYVIVFYLTNRKKPLN